MTDPHCTDCQEGASLGQNHNAGQYDEVDDLSKMVGQVSMDTDDAEVHDVDFELPKALIITNIHESVFTDEIIRAQFEAVFRTFEESVSIVFLRNFRRARVEYSQSSNAARARIELNGIEICGQNIKCYFAQPQPSTPSHDLHLHPPAPDKQFLISPPSSPPVGWEPVPEAQPVLNYDLLSAITRLAPGEAHELHPQSDSQPSIVVHACEDPEGFADRPIMQTRRPQSRTS